MNDLGVFKSDLMHKLPVGRKCVADDIYKTNETRDYIINKSEMDPPELQKFKNRIMARHEKFNGLLKNYDCLSTRFRHGVEAHGVCFRASCCLVQVGLDEGTLHLFDPVP